MPKLKDVLLEVDGVFCLDDFNALNDFLISQKTGWELKRKKQKTSLPPLGVADPDGRVLNPVSGFELSHEKFHPLIEIDGCGQFATATQWKSIGRSVFGAPSLVVKVYKSTVGYYSYENTR